MLTCLRSSVTLALLLLATMALAADPSSKLKELEAGFRDPPAAARPSVYWLLLNGYVNRESVPRELEALHAAGIRGLCLFDMGARGPKDATPPAGPAFMSDQSADDIALVIKQAGRLGMDVQLSVASSWDMGGAWVEPRHASMGLFWSHTEIEGGKAVDATLPLPPLPAAAPRKADGTPAFLQEVAVLALPAAKRLPGYDFIFRLDPPGEHALSHAVLCNTPSADAKKYGEKHLFTKDFSIAVSTTEPRDDAFREVLRASLAPHAKPQRFDLPDKTQARFVRLRVLSGHNPQFDRIELGEFQVFNAKGVNLAGSHEADRTRDGADLVRSPAAWGTDKAWTADNIHDGVISGPNGSWASDGPPPLVIDDPASIVDLSGKLDDAGRLRCDLPPGRWVLYRFVCANTGERLKVPSPNADGLATDHLSREATETFLNHLIAQLRKPLGDLKQTALKHLYLASYEVRGRIWTRDMLNQFKRYRGYELKPYLPVLTGSIVGDEETTARFWYDYRKTLGDLLVDAYYRAAVETAHKAGLGVESEAGGPGPPIHQVPVDALKAHGVLDEIRGEFWPRRPDADRLWVVKEVAAAAHIYGKTRVHMESFTSTHHWQDGPFNLKPSADRVFCEGANHIVWHTSAHQPPEAGRPGWVYGAGTHLNINEPWWPKAKPFLDYLARCSFMLQQGKPVADVCYYYGDQGYNFVPPKHIDPSLGFGYDYDVVNREVLLTRMTVRDGRLTLPDGVSYCLLVLPERDDIDLVVLRKIEQLVREGATVVGPKPSRATGLASYKDRDEMVRILAASLWGNCDGKTVTESRVGEGRVVWGKTLREVLKTHGIVPDLMPSKAGQQTDLDFIHRRTDEADVYFVRNKTARSMADDVTFRLQGRAPDIWHADSGRIERHYLGHEVPGGTKVKLSLDPYGSALLVFRAQRGEIRKPQITAYDKRDGRELTGVWDVQFPGAHDVPASLSFKTLISWTEHDLPSVRYYSGTATYHKEFDVAEDWLAQDRPVFLDLGDLWSVGEVWINDKPLGVLWKPPYRVDATAVLRPGKNTLKVEIANTWSNRLVGDALLPPGDRQTRTNITANNGVPWKDVPLIRSGLFGPVRLIPAKIVTGEVK